MTLKRFGSLALLLLASWLGALAPAAGQIGGGVQFGTVAPNIGGGIYAAYDSDAQAYFSAVETNGGTVSATRRGLINTLVVSLKQAGSWALMDDAWLLVAENQTQALTSLKQRRLATAVNSPSFTIDRRYTFDGASNYIATGFVPLNHAVVMAPTNLRLAAYERVNVATSTGHGAANVSTRNVYLLPLSANKIYAGLNFNGTLSANGVAVPGVDSRGYSVGSRTAAGVVEYFKNGASLGTVAPAFGSSFASVEMYIGAINSSGVAGSFRATQVGLVVVGAALTSSAQELADYNAWQAFMTAVGANV